MKKHAFILGVDGAGTFFRDASTPELDRMMKNGAYTYEMLTEIPTVSAQCWGSLLMGVDCQTHGRTNGYLGAHETDDFFEYPTLFRTVAAQRPQAKLASFSCWNPINHGIIEHNLNVTMGTGSDDEIAQSIVDYLAENIPTLLFAQFDSVDGAGHSHGYGADVKPFIERIGVVDGLLGKVYDAIEKAGILDDSLIIVVADHGGTPGGGHGGASDAEKYIYFGCRGAGVEGNIGKMRIMDVPPLVAKIMGLEPCDKWQGSVPEFFMK